MGQFYYFTDTGHVSDQTDADDAFGPQLDSTKYRFTHSQSHTGSATTIAVCTGTICVQRISGNSGTIILRPEKQPTFAFPFIQFFIYKNIDLSKFYSSAGLVSGHDIPFIEDPLFRENQGSIPENGAQELLGLTLDENHPEGGFADTDPVDHLFYTKNDERSLPRVKAGEKIGQFLTGSKCGFEVRLQRLGHNMTLGEVREAESILTVNSPTSNEAEIFEHWHKKDACLNYVDPVAFFGAFGETRLRYFQNGDKKTASHRNDLVTDVLSSCVNVDRVYLDLRNDYGFALNYFKDRGHMARLKSRKTSDDYLLDQTITGWPILSFTLSDLDNSGVFPGDIKRGFLRTSLELPQGDNMSSALAFLSRGFVRRWRNLKPEEKATQGITNPGETYTLPIRISLPIAEKNGTDQLCPNYFKINLYDMDREQDPETQTSLAPSKDHYLNGLFRPLDMEQTLLRRNEALSYTIWHEEILVNLSSDGGPAYIANIGVASDSETITLFAFPEFAIQELESDQLGGHFFKTVSSSKQISKTFLDHILVRSEKGIVQVIELIGTDIGNQILVLDRKSDFDQKYDIGNYVFLINSKIKFLDQKSTIQSLAVTNFPVFKVAAQSAEAIDTRNIAYNKTEFGISYPEIIGTNVSTKLIPLQTEMVSHADT